jgi:tetracycline 7-halogenase / FADH2 O2-dependent halogenase
MMMKNKKTDYDVAILGSGIGGTVLGSILAKNGVRTIIFEQGTHPRFAIGESTIPETTCMLRILSMRYGVPELFDLSNFHSLRARVSTNCGVKRNFSFLHHTQGQSCDPKHSTQFPTWAPPLGPDVHYFRQDVDAYMLAVATKYGATPRQGTFVEKVDIGEDCVEIRVKGGEVITSKYVVDAGGIKAPIAQAKGLRIEPAQWKTNSRTLYTHMVGVNPCDQVISAKECGLPSPLSQGTLHHLFDGGWIWCIPFNNHPQSTNPLVSVGLTLNIDKFPKKNLDPQREWDELIARFPTIRAQFGSARPIRPWMPTDRIQFQSTTSVGDRYILLPHAAHFIDPLFSSGLAVTMSAINVMASRMLSATKDGDWSGQRFAYVGEWVQKAYAYYDRLVSNAYTSWVSFELWNAWQRLWECGSLYGLAGAFEIMSRFQNTGDPSKFEMFEQTPYRGVQGIDFEPSADLFARCGGHIDAVRSGTLTPSQAASRIFGDIDASGLSPSPWRLEDPEVRSPGTFTMFPMMKVVAWGKLRAPASVKKHYFIAGRPQDAFRELGQMGFREAKRSTQTAISVLRDGFLSMNSDWKRKEIAENGMMPAVVTAESFEAMSQAQPEASPTKERPAQEAPAVQPRPPM